MMFVMNRTFLQLVALSFYALSCIMVLGQEKTGPRKLRLLPVGDMPPFRQEIRDGVRYELEPDPGTEPPRMISIPVTKEKTLTVPLALGTFTEFLPLPATLQMCRLQKAEGDEAELWSQIQLPEQGDCAVILWRDPKEDTWDVVRSLVIPEGSVTFPAGTVRLVNTLSTNSKWVFANKTIEVKAGGVLVEKLAAETVPVQVSVLDAEQNWRVVFQSAIGQGATERSNVILYRADGEEVRNPVKVINLREQANPAPVDAVAPPKP
jgi:hypothetical protein